MKPVYAFSNNKKTVNQLSLTGSVQAFLSPIYSDHESHIKSIMKLLRKELSPSRYLKFVVISGLLSEFSADAIEIRPLNL